MLMNDHNLSVGDRVLYVLPPGNGRAVEMVLPAVVLKITPTRIVIRPDGHRGHRNVKSESLRAPGGVE